MNITNTYYDFHRPLNNPVLTKMDVFNKVMDDKLMESKYATKLGQPSLSPLKIGGSIYRKPVYQTKDEDGEDDRELMGTKMAES